MAKIHWNACPLCFRQWCDCKLIEDQQKQIDAMKAALEQIKIADKTPQYDYGTGKDSMNRLGQLPGSGKRWLTPRELATVALFDSTKEALAPAQNVGGKT